MNRIEEHLDGELKVLVVSKKTGLEWTIDDYGEDKVKSALEANGENYNEYKEEYDTHYWSLNKVVQALDKCKISYDVILKQEISKALDSAQQEIQKQYNLIIPVGGDGTLLICTHYILDDRLLFGVNSVPMDMVKGSFGSIGGRLLSRGSSIESHIRQIADGETRIVEYDRLKAEVHNSTVQVGHSINDIFIGKDRMKRGSKYAMKVDDFPVYELQNGNGVLVCTRSGYPAWMKQIEDPNPAVFPADARMRYKSIWAHPAPGEKYAQTSGFPKDRIEVISGTFDAIVGVDGNFDYPLGRGHKVIVTMSDKPLYMVEFEK